MKSTAQFTLSLVNISHSCRGHKYGQESYGSAIDILKPVIFLTADSMRVAFSEHLAVGISNGPLKFSGARNIWPLLDLLAKFR